MACQGHGALAISAHVRGGDRPDHIIPNVSNRCEAGLGI